MKIIGNFLAVPINEILYPKANLVCYPSSFWMTIDNHVLFWRGRSPQCNTDKKVSDTLSKSILKEIDKNVQELPVTYFDKDHFESIFKGLTKTPGGRA